MSELLKEPLTTSQLIHLWLHVSKNVLFPQYKAIAPLQSDAWLRCFVEKLECALSFFTRLGKETINSYKSSFFEYIKNTMALSLSAQRTH